MTGMLKQKICLKLNYQIIIIDISINPIKNSTLIVLLI